MIFETSRYANSTVTPVADRDGNLVNAIEASRYYATSFTARKHVIKEGDRVDQLAFTYYRDPELWWIIAVANPEHLYPGDIPVGTVVRIPDASSVL